MAASHTFIILPAMLSDSHMFNSFYRNIQRLYTLPSRKILLQFFSNKCVPQASDALRMLLVELYNICLLLNLSDKAAQHCTDTGRGRFKAAACGGHVCKHQFTSLQNFYQFMQAVYQVCRVGFRYNCAVSGMELSSSVSIL